MAVGGPWAPSPGEPARQWNGQQWLWWDGQQWLPEQTAPYQPPPIQQPAPYAYPQHYVHPAVYPQYPTPAAQGWPGPPPTAWPVRVDSSRAWLLAIAPLLQVAVAAALLFAGNAQAVLIGVVAAIGLNTVVAIWDSSYLKSRGYRVSVGLALLIVPAYLYRRSRELTESQALFVAWIAAFVIAIAGGAALDSHFVTLNMNTVEQAITDDLNTQASTQATVSCPSRAVYAVHDTFLCSARDSANSVSVRVQVENSNGDITWQYLG
jgi:hypothetical protein